MSDPTYYILSARGGCQVSSGDDNDTHKYKDKDTDKDKYKDKVLQHTFAPPDSRISTACKRNNISEIVLSGYFYYHDTK